MPESGGPTTQSGILYQNAIAALYLGRLCDAVPRPDNRRVTHVRVEAPEDVDDTVVTFADEHRSFIQAKEHIREAHEAWRTCWQDFSSQFQRADFQRGRDRLVLHIGESRDQHEQLRELCKRARTSESYTEWWERLNQAQQNQVEKIKRWLATEILSATELLAFFSHIDVEMMSLEYIERDLIPYWMPQSTIAQHTLFRLLRDRVAEEARQRGQFTLESLRQNLTADGVQFSAPLDIDTIRAAVSACGALLRQHKSTIAATGKHIERAVVEDIITWAGDEAHQDQVALLLDQAGTGKTVVMRDVLCRLEDMDIAVLAIKADLQLSGLGSYAELPDKLHLPDSVERIVERLAQDMCVVVLIDQIDALSLSLAHDQQALNSVLDLVARLRYIPRVRTLLSCRIFDRNTDPRLKQTDIRKTFPIQELSDEEIKDVLLPFGIDFDILSPATRTLLRIPLHLDLFALVISGQDPQFAQRAGTQITSLQSLYSRLWNDIILKPDPNGPPLERRAEALRRIVERMHQDQQTTVPQGLFLHPEIAHLQASVAWLASEGILIRGENEWSLLHQTLFDYCYARYFVEGGGNLAEMIIQGDQGLFARPQLIQILAYLRNSDPRRYMGQLSSLFRATLRFHLRDLLTNWFGALPDPTDDEWMLARRRMLQPDARAKLLRAMLGNAGWFRQLNQGHLQTFLTLDDQIVDRDVIPYIASVFRVAQIEVVNLLRPYLGRNEQWNMRLASILANVGQWHTPEAIDLFEQLIQAMPGLHRHHIVDIDKFAAAYPRTACRFVRSTLDDILGQYLLKRAQAAEREDDDPIRRLAARPSLLSELEDLNSSMFVEAAEAISQAEPAFFIEMMLPWLEQVLHLTPPAKEDWPFHAADALSSGWYDSPYVVQHVIIQALISALTSLARADVEVFQPIAARLASLPYQTPQQLLTYVYRALPERYAEEAFRFLLADYKRLNLGDYEQYDSRQVIKSIYPLLSAQQREELEACIITYRPVYHHWGVEGPNRSRLDQLRLLQSVPYQYLSEGAQRYLQELEGEFPGYKVSETPIRRVSGFVGSPITVEEARGMSDEAWLSAMKQYHGTVEHQDALKGGAHQLSGVLLGLVKEHPERFYHLALQAPQDVDDAYVQAFINGLAESNAPESWLCDVIRRFIGDPERDIKRTIAWALQKRVTAGLPADLVDTLEQIVRGPIADDESYEAGVERDPYNTYLNSDRGSALITLMRALDQQATTKANQRKWELLDFIATDESTALRAGAIQELLYMLGDDRERAILFFESLMNGHPELMRSHDTQEFIYAGLYQYYTRMKPFIIAAMQDSSENVQKRGAELACIASISPKALGSDEALADAEALANTTLAGPVPWRRGAARIYAHNIDTDASTLCVQQLSQLLNDTDQHVKQTISAMFQRLGDVHVTTLRTFIETYAGSLAAHTRTRAFAEFLWKHGVVDPEWTISVIQIFLNNRTEPLEASQFMGGAEALIRTVLRVYTDPTIDAPVRQQSMDLFDQLMEYYTPYAQIALSEWDRR